MRNFIKWGFYLLYFEHNSHQIDVEMLIGPFNQEALNLEMFKSPYLRCFHQQPQSTKFSMNCYVIDQMHTLNRWNGKNQCIVVPFLHKYLGFLDKLYQKPMASLGWYLAYTKTFSRILRVYFLRLIEEFLRLREECPSEFILRYSSA